MFSKALVDYKKIGDFQQLTPVLVGVFTEDTELYPFFRGLLIKKHSMSDLQLTLWFLSSFVFSKIPKCCLIISVLILNPNSHYSYTLFCLISFEIQAMYDFLVSLLY